MNKRWHLPFLIFLIIGTIIIIGDNKPTYRTQQGKIFGTLYTITYEHNEDLQPLIIETLQAVDASLSPFNKNSVISHINNNEHFHVDSLFSEVFRNAEIIYDESHGAFDPTVAPLVNAWGFGFKQSSTITTSTIDSLQSLVGLYRVTLNNGFITKNDPRIMLDFSAIAKGYGSDRVAHVLDSCGIQNYMVEIGGEIVIKGHNKNGNPWGIGINKPIDDSLSTNQELQTVLRLTDCAIATSGNYRKFYIKDGKKYSHSIDPRTGYPVTHNLLSATIVAEDALTADAYATYCMVIGLEESKAFLESREDLEGCLIYDEDGTFKTWCSKGFVLEEI